MTDSLRDRVIAMADQRAGVDLAWARALALAVAAMVAHECVIECENLAAAYYAEYKGRWPFQPNGPNRANPHRDGMADGAGNCAAAIRQRAEGLK